MPTRTNYKLYIPYSGNFFKALNFHGCIIMHIRRDIHGIRGNCFREI